MEITAHKKTTFIQRLATLLKRKIGYRVRNRISWMLVVGCVLTILLTKLFAFTSPDYQFANALPNVTTKTAWVALDVTEKNSHKYTVTATLTPRPDFTDLYGHDAGERFSNHPVYTKTFPDLGIASASEIQEKVDDWNLKLIKGQDDKTEPEVTGRLQDVMYIFYEKTIKRYVTMLFQSFGLFACSLIVLVMFVRRCFSYMPVCLCLPVFIGNALVNIYPLMLVLE